MNIAPQRTESQAAVEAPPARLSCAILLSGAPRDDMSLEAAYIAAVLLDKGVDQDYAGANLSPAALELRALLREENAFCRLCGLTAAAEWWCWDLWISEYLTLLGGNRDEADRTLAAKQAEVNRILALAERVAQVTVAELASVGTFANIMRALGAAWAPPDRDHVADVADRMTGVGGLFPDPFRGLRRRVARVTV